MPDIGNKSLRLEMLMASDEKIISHMGVVFDHVVVVVVIDRAAQGQKVVSIFFLGRARDDSLLHLITNSGQEDVITEVL